MAFALGEALPQSRPVILFTVAASALALLTILALRRTLRLALLPTLALWVLCGTWARQIEPAPSPQTALTAYADGLSRTVQGRIVRIHAQNAAPNPTADSDANASADADRDFAAWDDPTTTAATTEDKLTVDLALTDIEDLTPDTSRMVPIAGGIRTSIYLRRASAPPGLRCGDTLEAPMRLRLPDRYRDPGAWQYADYLLTPGIVSPGIAAHATLSAAHLRIVETQHHGKPSVPHPRCPDLGRRPHPCLHRLPRQPPPPRRTSPLSQRRRHAQRHALRRPHTPQPPAPSRFERTGSFHLFVVSGMHVALSQAASSGSPAASAPRSGSPRSSPLSSPRPTRPLPASASPSSEPSA